MPGLIDLLNVALEGAEAGARGGRRCRAVPRRDQDHGQSQAHVGSYREEDWDLHPDGNRLVAAEPVNETRGSPDHVVVVLNFFDVLAEEVPE